MSNIGLSNLLGYYLPTYIQSCTMNIEFMQASAREAATLLKTMSHPDRLLVLCQLTAGEVCAGELQKNSQLSQSAFSQHLAVLKKYELVNVRKSSQQVFYSLADPRVETLIQTLHQLFCQQAEG